MQAGFHFLLNSAFRLNKFIQYMTTFLDNYNEAVDRAQSSFSNFRFDMLYNRVLLYTLAPIFLLGVCSSIPLK